MPPVPSPRLPLCLATLALLAAPVSSHAASFENWVETKLLPLDGSANNYFGNSVALSGTTALIGSPLDADNGGSASLFDTVTGVQTFKLTPNDGAADDFFGVSVALFGTTALVGSYLDDDKGSASGSAYLFDTTTGTQIGKLTPNDGAAEDLFGFSVALSETTALVGSRFDDDNGQNSGAAYLFDTNTGAQIGKLTPDDGAADDAFGFSVALYGSIALVGSYRDDDNGENSGSAYLFDTTTGAQIGKLTPDDGAAGDVFGYSVALSGTTALISSYNDGDNGEDSGSAYLFDTSTGAQVSKLTPEDGAAFDYFGASVALSGTMAVVGSSYDDDNGENSGSAYLFDPVTGAQIGKLTPDDGAADDLFGGSVALSGTTALVGSLFDDDNGSASGSAYLYTSSPAPIPLPAGVWLLGSALGILVLRAQRRVA